MATTPTIAEYAAAHERGLAGNIRNGCTPIDAAILYAAATRGIDFSYPNIKTLLRNAQTAYSNYYDSLNL